MRLPAKYENVPWLMQEVDLLYEKLAAKRNVTKLGLTTEQIIAKRGWAPSLTLISKNFDSVLTECQCFFVPKICQPGPMIVFPIRDIDGKYPRARCKPYEGSDKASMKYYDLGSSLIGPPWVGNSRAALARIVETQIAIIVEGPFDWLACKLLSPSLPVLTPLTKTLGLEHQAYLRILGVKTLYLLMDNERDKEDYTAVGIGNLSARAHARRIKTMNCEILRNRASDPSEALKSLGKARALKSQLDSLF